MKSNELRIGNYVSDEGASKSFYARVEKLSTRRCYYGPYNSTYEKLEPIPITEDWLLNLGFEKKEVTKWHGNGYDYQPEDVWTEQLDFVKDTNGGWDFIFRFENWTYKEIPNLSTSIHYTDSWYPKINEQVYAEIKYVHQLQNLYFALTGEELTLQP